MSKLIRVFIILFIGASFFSCKKKLDTKNIEKIATNTNPEVVGYLPSYNMWSVSSIDFSKLTQVLYFSLTPNTNGSLSIPSNAVSNINLIKTNIGTNDVDILISIGGAGKSGNFPSMSSTEAKRAIFISQLKDFCLDNGLVGADIDWEFPNNATELSNCTLLLMEMQQVFHENNLIVTSAQRAVAADLEDEALQYLDQLHVMAYDAGSYHSTYEYAVSSVNHFLNRGMPRSKIILGVPFYGRSILQFSDESSYRSIHNTYNTQADEDEGGNYYFNGPDMISNKTKYSMEQGLMGVMIWDISMDTYDDSSLLKAIDDTKKSFQ